jgi:outer membrane lipoprotein-sorting protein
MRCERAQLERNAGAPNFRMAWRIRRHLRKCSACAAAVEETRRLEARLQANLDDAPPAHLRKRISDALAESASKNRPASLSRPDKEASGLRGGLRMKGRFVTGIAAVCALGMLAAGFWNNSAFGEMERLENAVSDVKSAHQVWWKIGPDGARSKEAETWYQEGEWRIETDDENRPSVQIYNGGRLYSYDKKTDKVTYWRAKGPFGFNPSGFSIKAMIGDEGRWGWKDRIERQGRGVLNGRAVEKVLVLRANEPDRTLISVDSRTDRPIRMETETERGGEWITSGLAEMEYDRPIPPSAFDPRGVSKTATFFNRDEGKRLWGEKLAKGIAKRRLGSRTVVLRDVQVNDDGDVFILYTAGSPVDPWAGFAFNVGSIGVTDNLGTRYITTDCSLSPVEFSSSAPPKGYVFERAMLEGVWFAPLEPMKKRARSLTITFATPKVRRPAVFVFPLRSPTVSVVPEWMPYMGYGPRRDWEIAFYQAKARAQQFRRNGDHAKAAEMFREALKVGKWDNNADTLCDLGDELAALGDKAGALESYRKAQDQPALQQEERDRIARGMARAQ